MAEKKAPMGDDPLAWLTEGDELDKTESQPAAKPRARTRRGAASRQPVKKEKTEVELLEESFAALAPQGEALAARFYQLLFENYPQVIPLFSGGSTSEQQKKLLAALVLLVQNLHKPDVLSDYLKGLGSRHMHYGVTVEHYPFVAESLLGAMEEFAGELWTPAVQKAWENTLDTVATIMLQAYEPVEADKMANTKLELDQEVKNTLAAYESQINAISKVMGVISFEMDGTIIDINQNFLDVVGYRKEEVIGKHHRMFAEPSLASSQEYTEFWAKLNRGEFDSGEYKRLGNGGREIWLEASYNPILDTEGRPVKVIKYATDITEKKELQLTVQRALGATREIMMRIAEGDLTQHLTGEYEGEFALLQTAVNDTVSKISNIVKNINETTTSITAAASEISEGNLDLSQRTEQQASSLEETAASMEELTSTVRQNSDNARQANQLASTAREQAEKGGSVIKDAISAMIAISASSKKVTDIIGVIDEIAFQTNLLALNAAVEAARAGEQGRGFAVVASEVRNLAQRSASAAKEIKELINDSGEKVKEGSMLVDESGRTLEEIVSGAKKVGDIISEIAAAGAEQSQGIEQVNQAVTQMDEMTQQNAALVEEAAAASESLDEQGRGLQQMMSFFKVDGSDATTNTIKDDSQPIKKPLAKSAVKAKPEKLDVTSNDDEWDEF